MLIRLRLVWRVLVILFSVLVMLLLLVMVEIKWVELKVLGEVFVGNEEFLIYYSLIKVR